MRSSSPLITSSLQLITSPLQLITAILFALQASAVLVNVTIDDTNGDPRTGSMITYSPRDAWKRPNCKGCTAHPDPTMMHMGTWTDSTANSELSPTPPNTIISASVNFNGTSVFVFCALARTSTGPTGNSDMTFVIDGSVESVFYRLAPNSSGYDYNFPVFARSGLPQGQHSLEIRNGEANGPKSLILLDSIVYTYDDGTLDDANAKPVAPPAGPSRKSPTTTIIIAVVASIGGLGFVVLAFFLYRRHRTPKPLDRNNVLDGEFSPTHTSMMAQSSRPSLRALGSSSRSMNSEENRSQTLMPPPRDPERAKPLRPPPESSGQSTPLGTLHPFTQGLSQPRSDTSSQAPMINPVPNSGRHGVGDADAPPAYDFVENGQNPPVDRRRSRRGRKYRRTEP